MALRTHNILLDVLRIVFGDVDEAMFEDVERPQELIFCILSIKRGDLNGRL
jgi:hypothetical protein